MKYKLMILFGIVMILSKITHKNLTNVSTQKVHFQETFVMKNEDNICRYFTKGDTTIKIGKTYTTLDECIVDGGELLKSIKPKINKLELN